MTVLIKKKQEVYLTIHNPPAPKEQVDGCSGCLGDTKWTCIRLRKSSNTVQQPITPEPTTSTFIVILRYRQFIEYLPTQDSYVRYINIVVILQ